MTLHDYYDRHYSRSKLLGARPATLAEYRATLGHWSRFRPTRAIDAIDAADLADLADKLLNVEQDAPATVNKILRHLRGILGHAARRGYRGPVPPWDELREPKRAPLAFTVEEFSRLIHAARLEPGTMGGIPAAIWWESLLRSIWFSGARISAMLAVLRADVLIERGGFYVRAETQKHVADQFFPVDADTLHCWQRMWLPERRIFWPYSVCEKTLWRRFRRMVNRAEIDNPARKGFHRIRCSTASYLKAHGGNPTEQLGHSSPSVTRAYYDPRIVTDSSILKFMPRIPPLA